MLWLCLHFPQLPLEIHSRADARPLPWAVTEGKGRRETLLLCNAPALALGIRPGMASGAAYALAATLHLRPRDEAAEQQALASLAGWAGQFTSQVSLLPPQALLLEIEGSLNLFRGLEALLRRVQRRAALLGYASEWGVAPTPLAAWLLARAQITSPVTAVEALPAALRDLPITLLDLEDKRVATLEGLGLRHLGEILRLPRAGLARRLGPDLLDYLDRLLGHRADLRQPYVPPPRFIQRIPLPAEILDHEALLFPARRLLLELAGFLLSRQAGTQELVWTLSHHRKPATQIALRLAAPNRDAHHLLTLLRERLARTQLPAPVEALTLEVTDIRPLSPRPLALDGEQAAPAEDWPLLVERLRARLGEAAVHSLQSYPDHRPERAWRPCPAGTPNPPLLPRALRPLWLLPEPLALPSRDGSPWLEGRLYIESGPERIEGGWWDGGHVARDYFIARDGGHSRYWIFRERHAGRRWFLHGLFA